MYEISDEEFSNVSFLGPSLTSVPARKKATIEKSLLFYLLFTVKLDFVNGLSVIEAELFTGRMHQIRATLFSLGYPVAGDKLYGLDENFYLKQRSDELTESDREKLLLSRQALHSAYLEFTGISGEKLFFSSPMPDDMKKLTTET